MERDLDVVPGLKIAGCVILVITVVAAAIYFLWYPIAYGFNNMTRGLDKLGPVDFYGKVVDPDGNGLAGVTLTVEIKSFGIFRGYFDRMMTLETDSTGRFRIQARKAHSLVLYDFSKSGFLIRGRPEKRGQDLELLDFWPFRVNPYNNPNLPATDEQNPYTFVMEQPSGPNKAEISSPTPPRVD